MAITLYYRIIKTKKESKVVLCATVLATLLLQDLFLLVCTQFVYICCCFCVFFIDFFLSVSLCFSLFSFITIQRMQLFFCSKLFLFSLSYLFGAFCLVRHFNPTAVIAHDSGPETFRSTRHLFVCYICVDDNIPLTNKYPLIMFLYATEDP